MMMTMIATVIVTMMNGKTLWTGYGQYLSACVYIYVYVRRCGCVCVSKPWYGSHKQANNYFIIQYRTIVKLTRRHAPASAVLWL